MHLLLLGALLLLEVLTSNTLGLDSSNLLGTAQCARFTEGVQYT